MQLLKAGFLPLFKENFFQSSWTLTEKCNFKCSYCVNQKERDNTTHLKRETMLKALGYMADLKRPKYNFALSGGEVTLYPHLEEMLATINNKFTESTCSIRLLSNGSASVNKMEKLFVLSSKHNMMFIITLHLEELNVDSLIKKIKTFPKEIQKSCFLFKVIVSPERMEQALDVIALLEETKLLNYRIMPVCDFVDGKISSEFSLKQREQIAALCKAQKDKIYFKFTHLYRVGSEVESKVFTYTEGIEQEMFNYKGMYCSAGYNSIRLTAKGYVKKTGFCGDMNYTISDKNPFEDSNFYVPKKCIAPHCTCITHARLPKWSSFEFAPEFLKENK